VIVGLAPEEHACWEKINFQKMKISLTEIALKIILARWI
jgi:hypothetical protein